MNQEESNNQGIKAFKNSFERDEIEIQELINSFCRHKIANIIILSSSVFLSSIYAFTKTPTWEGGFQIVLSDRENRRVSTLDIPIALKNYLTTPKKKLTTEIGILKSPSVLMPVFNRVKKMKKESGSNIDNKRYSRWLRDNVKVELSKGTTILNLSYFDTNKDLIIPILNDISDTYKSYSFREKQQSISSSLKFVNSQINFYKNKNLSDIKKTEEFANKNELNINFISESMRDKFALTDGQSFSTLITNLPSERMRLSSKNKAKNAKLTLDLLNKLNPKERNLTYMIKLIPTLDELDIAKEARKLELLLSIKRSKFTEKSREIKSLVNEINFLNNQIFDYAKSNLAATISQAEANEKIAERPLETLLKYSALLRNSFDSETKLVQLEKEKLLLTLENAKQLKSWELITKPTLKKNPVSPKKFKIIGFGFAAGLITSILVSLSIDKRKDVLYSKEQIAKILRISNIIEFSFSDLENGDESLELFIDKTIKTSKASEIAFIKLGQISDFDSFSKKLQEIKKDIKLIVSNKLIDTKGSDLKMIILNAGEITRREAMKFRNKMNIMNEKINCLIILKK